MHNHHSEDPPLPDGLTFQQFLALQQLDRSWQHTNLAETEFTPAGPQYNLYSNPTLYRESLDIPLSDQPQEDAGGHRQHSTQMGLHQLSSLYLGSTAQRAAVDNGISFHPLSSSTHGHSPYQPHFERHHGHNNLGVLHYKNTWDQYNSSGSGTPVGSVRQSSSATSMADGQYPADDARPQQLYAFGDNKTPHLPLQMENAPHHSMVQQTMPLTHVGAQHFHDGTQGPPVDASTYEHTHHHTIHSDIDCADHEHQFRRVVDVTDEADEVSGPTKACIGPVRNKKRGQRSKFTEPERQTVADTRKIGACTRCRVHKWKCVKNPADPEGRCLNCMNPSLRETPCLRFKSELPGVRLYAIGDTPLLDWTKRWSIMQIQEIPSSDWDGNEVFEFRIAQGVGNTSYGVKVRRFVPCSGDAVQRSWNVDGKRDSWATEPYALENMEATVAVIRQFIADTCSEAVFHELKDKDELLQHTYAAMLNHANNVKDPAHERVLRDCLHLWVAIRMESRSDHIVGAEAVGLQPCDIDGPNKDKVLLSPVLSAQLNIIMASRILHELKKRVLEGLQKLMKGSQKPNWYTVYLCSFVLLHSCSLFTDWERRWAKKRGCETTYRDGSLVHDMHHGAKMLLSYYHSFLRGKQPFSANLSAKQWRDLAGLDDDNQVKFLMWTATEIVNKKQHIDHVRTELMYEDDYYFLSHLFDEKWSYIDSFFYGMPAGT